MCVNMLQNNISVPKKEEKTQIKVKTFPVEEVILYKQEHLFK